MLVSKNAKVCFTPNANPQSQGSQIKFALGPLALGLALAMYISYFLCPFHLRWVANFQWNMGLNFLSALVSLMAFVAFIFI